MSLSLDFNALPFPLLQIGGEGHIERANPRWVEFFGVSPAQSFEWREALDAPGLSLWNSLWEEHRRDGRAFQCGVRLNSANGEKRGVLVAEPQGAGADASWLVMATDIEDVVDEIVAGYEQDEVALRMALQQWHSFFHESATGKAVVGQGGEIMAVNPQLCHLFGYDEAEMLRLAPRELRHPEDVSRMELIYESLLEGGPPRQGIEVRYRRRDGSSIHLLVSISLVRDSKGHPLYFAVEIQDDSARREAEIALGSKIRESTRLNQELERSNSDLERFAFVASHDLQEPLRKIRVFGGRLEKALEGLELGESSRDYLTRMLGATERMQQLISDLLEFSRPTAPANLQEVDLTLLARDAASDFDATLEASGGKVEIEPLLTVVGDASRLRQLLCNLISNALKFRGDEAPLVHISARRVAASEVVHLDGHIDRESDGEKSWCEILVRDNGIGFDEKDLPRLLEVFGRLHPRNRFAGTGIGLAICRKVAQEHGGDISAHSRPGEGATFIVALPIRHEISVS